MSSVISGLTNGKVKISEGYLSKLQKNSSNCLGEFINNLKGKITNLRHLYCDDTTIRFGIKKPIEGYDDKDLEYIEKINNRDITRNGII